MAKTVVLQVRITEGERFALQQRAEREGVTLTSLVRGVLLDGWLPRDIVTHPAQVDTTARFDPLSIPGVFLGMPPDREATRPSQPFEPETQPLCTYKEWDEVAGEWFGCRLPVHSAKVKHQRGAAL